MTLRALEAGIEYLSLRPRLFPRRRLNEEFLRAYYDGYDRPYDHTQMESSDNKHVLHNQPQFGDVGTHWRRCTPVARPSHRAGESGSQLEHQEDKLQPSLHALGPEPMSQGWISDQSHVTENYRRPRGEDHGPAEDNVPATQVPEALHQRGRVHPHLVRLIRLEGMEV